MTETTVPALTFDPYGSVLEARGWTETRDDGTHEISEQLSVGPSFWSTPSAVDGEPPIIVRVRYNGSVCFPPELGRLDSATLRAFAAIADREHKDVARQQSPNVFNLSPEQQTLVDNLVARMAAVGIECTSDEAQMFVNLAEYGRQTIDRADEQPDAFKLRTKKTSELIGGGTRVSQMCLAVLAKLVIRQYRSDYNNDANLRGLDIIDTLLHIVAVLAPDKKKVKHLHG